MALNILITFLGIFLVVFLEGFLIALFNFKLSIIIFFFLFKKVDWKLLLIAFFVLFLIFDVVNNLPLGSNMIMLSLPLGLLVLSSLFFSSDVGIGALLIRVVVFFSYYVLSIVFPSFVTVGNLGSLTLRDILVSFLKAVVSALLLALFEYLLAGFRKRGNTSQIRLK